jgi:hypothetical protein
MAIARGAEAARRLPPSAVGACGLSRPIFNKFCKVIFVSDQPKLAAQAAVTQPPFRSNCGKLKRLPASTLPDRT